jgi:hypothetical protein
MKKNVLFEKNCHVTEKSEAIACAMRCRSSQLKRAVDKKRIVGKNGGPRRRKGTKRRQQQGCQIFLGKYYPNRKTFSKGTQNVPNGHKISPLPVKYSKRP